MLQQGEDVLRLRVRSRENGCCCLRQNLIAGQVRSFGREIGVHDGRFGSRDVFERDAETAHRRTDGEGLERTEAASQRAHLGDCAVEDILSHGEVVAGEVIGAAASDGAEESVERIAQIAGGDGADADGGLAVLGNLRAELEGCAAAGDVEGAGLRLVESCRDVEADVEG